jgi:hypothetical protein
MSQSDARSKPEPARFPSRPNTVPSASRFLEVNLKDWMPEALDNTRHCPLIPRMARTTCVVKQVRRFSHVTA